MAIRELFEISRSRTFRSLRASAARSGTCLVGLRFDSARDRMPREARDVSMVGMSSRGVARGIGVALASADGKDEAEGVSTIVEHLRACQALGGSIEENVGESLRRTPSCVEACFSNNGSVSSSADKLWRFGAFKSDEGAGLSPKICDAPFLYDRCIFSLLCVGDGDLAARAATGAKKGDAADRELKAGDCKGGLLVGGAAYSGRGHGPADT